MTKQCTLHDIRAAAEAKYADVEIDGVVFVNALRLPKEKRKALANLQDEMSGGDEGDEVDQVEVFANALRTVCKNPSKLDDLLKKIGGDLTVLVEIFNFYANSTQVGEASASQD